MTAATAAAAVVAAFKPRALAARSLAFDLTAGLALTLYLHLATYGLHPHLTASYVAQGIAVATRRLWTMLAALLTLAIAATSEVTQWPYPLGVAVIIYTLAASRLPRRFTWAYTILAAILLTAPSPYADLAQPRRLAQIIPEALMITIAPLLGGLYARERQQLIESMAQRAIETEQRHLHDVQRQRAEERNRLANEIHDVLAHTVSLIIVHSGALSLTAHDQRTRDTAEHLRAAGATALDELRDIVAVLRDDSTTQLTPTAALSSLPALIGQVQADGMEVSYQTTGIPRKLPGTVERTAYLIIEQALAQTRGHSHRIPVTITLGWQPSTLDVTITGKPTPESGSPPPDLNHLSARINLLAGTLTTSHTPHGGWAIHTSLPTTTSR